MHKENCFITLTYDDDHLPDDGSLRKRDWQLFAKKLRRRFEPKRFRYYHCGEYGERNRRPHYHACLFGVDFRDKELWTVRDDVPLYRSALLSEVWGQGFCTVGEVTFESAAYVARYVMKKVTGAAAEDHYVCRETGAVLEPEYTTMSRGDKHGSGGIGRGFYDRYRDDLFPRDVCVVRSVQCAVPRYYSGLYELDCPERYEEVRARRQEKARRYDHDRTPERLRAREICTEARVDRLVRPLGDK